MILLNVKIKLTVFAFLILTYTVNAQVKIKSIFTFNYSFGKATGSINDFIPDKSFNGFNMDYRHFFKEKYSIGMRAGWNSFKTVLPRQVLQVSNTTTVSAIQTRYFYSFPVTGFADYYFKKFKYFVPYAGAGMGLYYLYYTNWFGIAEFKATRVRFGLYPEVGFIVPFKDTGIGVLFNARFNEVFYKFREVHNLRYFEFCVGIYFGHF